MSLGIACQTKVLKLIGGAVYFRVPNFTSFLFIVIEGNIENGKSVGHGLPFRWVGMRDRRPNTGAGDQSLRSTLRPLEKEMGNLNGCCGGNGGTSSRMEPGCFQWPV